MYCEQCLQPLKVGDVVVVEENYLLERILLHKNGCHQKWLNGEPKPIPPKPIPRMVNRQAEKLMHLVGK